MVDAASPSKDFTNNRFDRDYVEFNVRISVPCRGVKVNLRGQTETLTGPKGFGGSISSH